MTETDEGRSPIDNPSKMITKGSLLLLLLSIVVSDCSAPCCYNTKARLHVTVRGMVTVGSPQPVVCGINEKSFPL